MEQLQFICETLLKVPSTLGSEPTNTMFQSTTDLYEALLEFEFMNQFHFFIYSSIFSTYLGRWFEPSWRRNV